MIHNSVYNKSAINNKTLTDLHLLYIHFTHHSPTHQFTQIKIIETLKAHSTQPKKKKKAVYIYIYNLV